MFGSNNVISPLCNTNNHHTKQSNTDNLPDHPLHQARASSNHQTKNPYPLKKPPTQTTYTSLTLKGLPKAPPIKSPNPISTPLTPSILIKKCTTLLSTTYPLFFHLALSQSVSASLLFAQSYLYQDDKITLATGEGGQTNSGLALMVVVVEEEVEERVLTVLVERERWEEENEDVGLWQRGGMTRLRLRSERLGR